MPRSTLSLGRVQELLPSPMTPEALVESLFSSKAEVEGREGDRLAVSVTPDRLDLLSEGGLAAWLAGAVGAARGIVPLRRARARGLGMRVETSVGALRPHLAGVVVRAPTGKRLDESLLAEAVRFQEMLHATIGRDRRAMSLGIYPARRLVGPIRYAAEPLASVRFVPLHGSDELPAARFFAEDPMAARYGSLGLSGESCLTLRDGTGALLSLPPVLNSANAGEARVGDRVLLLEATGTRERSVREGLGLLLVVFASRGWSLQPVPVEHANGAVDDGASLVGVRTVELEAATVRSISGEAWAASEVVERIARARLSARRAKGGWKVAVPPWRGDLLTGVDVAEDVLLAREVKAEVGIVPPSPTRGRRRPETAFRRRVGRLLLGLGFQQPHTPVLVSEASVQRLSESGALHLSNPVSRELAYLRDRLFLSHLEVLERNTRHGYPQRFAEVGPVVVRSSDAETGAATRYHASALLAGEGQGFAEAASLVDYLLRALDVGSVREPAELPGTIPGRAARVRVAGEPVAEFGEVHPKLLVEMGVPVPVVWAEVDLSALWPLTGGRDTA